MAWVVRRMPAELRRGCAEKRLRGWRKMLAQMVAASCEDGVQFGKRGGRREGRTIQMPAWAIIAVPAVRLVIVGIFC